jgi:hypothetical protein
MIQFLSLLCTTNSPFQSSVFSEASASKNSARTVHQTTLAQ